MMMNLVYQAHSGVRYLVLLSALVALAVLVRGLLGNRPFDRAARIATASFSGFLQLQFVLGLVLVFLRPWYGALIGHITMMILAVGAAQMLTKWAKQATEPGRAYRLALAAVGVALVLVVGGIFAIGRHPFQSLAF
jgi:hypothetical protein